jgi:glycine amidinotransferase
MLARWLRGGTRSQACRRFSSAAGQRVVWAWNEFDPLEEVIVGIADGSAVPPNEPGHMSKVWHLPGTIADMGKMRPADKVQKAEAELDNFAAVLEARGIIVRRPAKTPNTAVTAPLWTSPVMNGWTCPRDTLLVVGNEIIEAPLCWRSRAYEKFAYRHILADYHARDPDFLWSSAPHPSIPDELFRPDYNEPGMTMERRLEQMARREFVTVDGVEPVFDAADAIRCGRDVFVLHSHTCNVLGFEWLKRHLALRGLRTHLVTMPTVHNPSHIDASIMPLRPPVGNERGVILVAPPVVDSPMVGLFGENNWDILRCPEPDDWMSRDPDYKGKSSKWIAINVLALDTETVVVAEHDESLIRALEERHFKCVPIPFKNVIEFGGGIHCGTQDVRRRGKCEDYFPTLRSSHMTSDEQLRSFE